MNIENFIVQKFESKIFDLKEKLKTQPENGRCKSFRQFLKNSNSDKELAVTLAVKFTKSKILEFSCMRPGAKSKVWGQGIKRR